MVAAPSPAASGAPTRLILLYGGQSAEHEVSCISARHVLAACDPARYAIEVVGIGTDGRWVDVTGTAGALAADEASLPTPDSVLAAGAAALHDPVAHIRGGTDWATPADPPVVWPVLHGPMGEDGTVQGLCAMAGAAWVGAGVAGSAAAMDKALAKTAFAGAGIPQARWSVVDAATLDEGAAELAVVAKAVEADLGWPVFVKPANMGSTIGVARAGDPAAFVAAVEAAARYDDTVIVEEEIRGRELEIGVLGLDAPETSIIGEIVPSHEFYDFEDKYTTGTAGLLVPAPLPDSVAGQMADLALMACRAVRVDTMARVDFFLEESTGRLLLNEINTLPGFTPISMYPRLWAASGVPYGDLVDRLVAMALRRAKRRARLRVTR